MNQLGKILNGIQLVLARISGTLLMIGLVIAMVNFLEAGALFVLVPWLSWYWSISQALAVDSNLWLVFVFLVAAWENKERAKVVVYSIIGTMLLFVAISITNVEAVRQVLNVSLSEAFGYVRVPILLLTWVRSVVAVLLVAVSGLGGIEGLAHNEPAPPSIASPAIRGDGGSSNGNGSKKEQYVLLLSEAPNTTNKQAAEGLGVSTATVQRWNREIKRGERVVV